MRIRKCLDGLNSHAFALRQRRTGGLADAVDDEDRSRLEAGGVVGRRGMSQVMGHKFESPAELPAHEPVGSVADLTQALQEGIFHLAVRPPIRMIFRTA